MRLELGPFSSAGGREWVAQARSLVALLRAGPALPFAVPPEVLDVFEWDLDEWDRAAGEEPFVWSTEVEVDVLRTLMRYWVNLAQYLAENPHHRPPGTAEAQAFYRRLSSAILDALVAEDPGSAVLGERWPQR